MTELLKLIALLPASVKALLEAHPDLPHVSAAKQLESLPAPTALMPHCILQHSIMWTIQ